MLVAYRRRPLASHGLNRSSRRFSPPLSRTELSLKRTYPLCPKKALSLCTKVNKMPTGERIANYFCCSRDGSSAPWMSSTWMTANCCSCRLYLPAVSTVSGACRPITGPLSSGSCLQTASRRFPVHKMGRVCTLRVFPFATVARCKRSARSSSHQPIYAATRRLIVWMKTALRTRVDTIAASIPGSVMYS